MKPISLSLSRSNVFLLPCQAGSRRFVSIHMLVPSDWTVHDAHHLAEEFEGDIRAGLGEAAVSTHLEPIEDEISMQDVHEK